MKYLHAYRVSNLEGKGIQSKDDFCIVNSAGYYEFDDDGYVTHRKNGRHDFYLSYLHAGKMKIGMDKQVHNVMPGTVFLYKPYEEQYYGQKDEESIANYWVHFTGYGVSELINKVYLGEGGIFHIGISEELPALFEEVINEITEKSINYEQVSALLLQQIIFIISRRIEQNEKRKQQSKGEMIISGILNFIHKHYSAKMTVKELADRARLSVSRFCAVFKQYTGLSPQQYIIKYKLEQAKDFMIRTNLSIKQVAAIVGFEDQMYFSKLFKKYYFLPPSKYVLELQNGDCL
jgi:AraC family transcriptional regulator of arabinose operon